MKAVVTGSASGIGAACVQALAEAGYEVLGWDLNSPERVDVASSASVAQAAAGVGELDAVVLAAGVSRMAPLLETTDEDWNFQMGVNAFGVFNCVRALAPKVRRGGSIVIIDSMGGLRGAPFLSAYCASKFAVSGLIESATPELAVHGIRINGVCPMYVRTPMETRELAWEAELTHKTPEQVFADYERTTPLGRVAEPAEVASVVRFLAGEESSYLTGVLLPVSGGAHLGFTVDN
ncbi:NAD(P)-dependent dehydrogenase (short-subunit alcohol dehydrogenase family) [Propionicimonas paludicola]|uniref:NAD(P)-dependent dehydrogenase (Short-subunit alcohol dehydrogenase family) n=1 Tax=Propionicimonas paludicola TaxID=185243 RepID=A0A2A9CNS1_9ACTN|nr:SDR family oxidoreductase [Propionicimonas paludicola]PFG15796.1 NAD(P)-dependent dehydrogenase (short-subunit alcohol dehydrogenase family) [Propionicimonas paludicola]